ncbi:MAG: hypothetical protein A3C36_04455 [Omnitrophica WOR_2 bacterium RIFCSPHIGHO2_02_FULL_52_10]|nr:MAG: hypothetical protein A3C36_04455 [Omnitrophica WOR_2 bacterium RIFCSPHIGHO2_02_FULL_52_10]
MGPHYLPTVNACLNATAFVLLMVGWRAIKAGHRVRHQKFMIAALIASSLFLCSYVTYHYLIHGAVTRYQGTGIWRCVYFTILVTHTPLAMAIVPFCAMAVYHAVRGNFTAHVKITRWLFPAWVYVSVTGVAIYLMLYVF